MLKYYKTYLVTLIFNYLKVFTQVWQKTPGIIVFEIVEPWQFWETFSLKLRFTIDFLLNSLLRKLKRFGWCGSAEIVG